MKIKRIEVNACGGINPQSPVIIDFSKSNFVVAEGDNGVNKTSLLSALLMGCGEISPGTKEGKNLVNIDSSKIDINMDFVGNDRCNYHVRCTKSKFELTYEGEAVPEPLTKMKELLGVVGISPMAYKNKPLKDLIPWLASYSKKSPEEFDNAIGTIKAHLKTSREARATANKSYKGLKEYLENEEMYINWEATEKKWAKEPTSVEKLSKQLTIAGNKHDEYLRSENGLATLKSKKVEIENQITLLQKQLSEIEPRITDGEKWLDTNKADKTNYDTVKKEYDNAAKNVLEFNSWKEIKKKKSEMDEFETLSQKADAKEKELLKQMKELQAEILPDIKGVELITEDTTEDGITKKEGLYWNGVNVAQMSETEFWALVMQIWRKYKTKVIVVDNMQSLGSKGVELLEKLAKDGAYILAAEMDRKKKTLEIAYV